MTLELITFVMIIAKDVGWRQHVFHALLTIGSMNSLVRHVWDHPQNCRTWAVFYKNVAGPLSSSHLCQDKNIFWNRKLIGLKNIKRLDFFCSQKKQNIRGGILTRILLISHSLKMIATDKIHSTRGARSSSIGGIGQHIILNSCCHFFSQHIPFLMLLTRWITGGLKHTKTCFSLLAYFNSCINPVRWYKMQTWR